MGATPRIPEEPVIQMTKTRVPLARAQVVAAEVVALLAPACERIEIAGSVRREKTDVGDIEIVCTPSVYHASQPVLGTLSTSHLPARIIISQKIK